MNISQYMHMLNAFVPPYKIKFKILFFGLHFCDSTSTALNLICITAHGG